MLHKIKDTLVLNRDMRPMSMLPPTTIKWETAVKCLYTGAAQLVHEYDNWVVHSPSTTMKVPSVVMVREYVHYQKAIPWNFEYAALRDEYKCQYCLKKFGVQQLTEDHVIPRKFGGTTGWDNIVSACAPCNHSRGHNQKIRPANIPRKPSYWELVDKIKKLNLVIPDQIWENYLGWPKENLYIK